MKYLFVSNFDKNPNSGAAGTLLEIGKALKELGHEVDYLWQVQKPYRFKNGTLQTLLELPKRQYAQVAEQLAKKEYDVVSVSQPFAYLIYENLKGKYPKTLFLNRTHGWEARVIDAYKRFSWDGAINPFKKIWKAWRDKKIINFCERTLKACDGLIAPSKLCRSFILENSNEKVSAKLATIPYGLSKDFMGFPSPKESQAKCKMLYVGNYLPIKGSLVMERLLPEIGKKYSEAYLTFVVPEPQVSEVRNRFAKSFGDRLDVLAWVERESLKDIYQAHNILLYPSLFEGFSKVLLEAMASGLCVIGFDEGGISDITKSGEGAFFVPVGDENALLDQLSYCFENSNEISKIATTAQKLVQDYSWIRHAKEVEMFCQKLIHQSQTSPEVL